jgi:PD-(D/E)XK endonuclease
VFVASTKSKGDLAEIIVAADLLRRGYKIAFPHGEDWDFDLVLYREGVLERVQAKYTESDGRVVVVRCRSHSLTNGHVRATKKYTSRTIDWLAVYDATTKQCFYIPASELIDGRSTMALRIAAPRNCQRAGIRWAADYHSLG